MDLLVNPMRLIPIGEIVSGVEASCLGTVAGNC